MADIGIWLYVINILGNLSALLGIGLFVCAIICFVKLFYGLVSLDSRGSGWAISDFSKFIGLRNNIMLYSVFILSALLLVAIPNERTAYLILGLNVTQNAYELNKQDVDETTKLVFENVKKRLREALVEKETTSK